MKNVACRYAIIQFMPYPETGEFANIGIVLMCPKTGYFSYQLQTRKYARYTHFFKDLQHSLYTRAAAGFKMELDRVQRLVIGTPEIHLRRQFQALLHPRDTVIRFGDERACLTANPEKELKKLYLHYVEHDFVTPEYKAQKLEMRVNRIIKDLNLEYPFRKESIGREDYSVVFPLVQIINHQPKKVIKPFFLGQNEPSRIYDHADLWIAKLKRLKARNQLPQDVLFTVEGPDDGNINNLRQKAFREVCVNLKEVALIADVNDEPTLRDFARGS
jgi:hypothetical protein